MSHRGLGSSPRWRHRVGVPFHVVEDRPLLSVDLKRSLVKHEARCRRWFYGDTISSGQGGDPDHSFPVQHLKLLPPRGQFRITWVKRPRVSTLITTEAHLIVQAGDEDISRRWVGVRYVGGSLIGGMGRRITGRRAVHKGTENGPNMISIRACQTGAPRPMLGQRGAAGIPPSLPGRSKHPARAPGQPPGVPFIPRPGGSSLAPHLQATIADRLCVSVALA